MKKATTKVLVNASRVGGRTTYDFRVEVENYGDVKISLASVAPLDVRAIVIGSFAAAVAFWTYGLIASAGWASIFGCACAMLGFQVETWTWKHIAKRYALIAASLAQSDAEKVEMPGVASASLAQKLAERELHALKKHRTQE
jgi:hypothetical protein